MKIYLAVEEYKGEKYLLSSIDEYGHPDYSLGTAQETCRKWGEIHRHLGATYTVREIEL